MLILTILAILAINLPDRCAATKVVELEPLPRRFWSQPPPGKGYTENCKNTKTSIRPKPTEDPSCKQKGHKHCQPYNGNINSTSTNGTSPSPSVPINVTLQQQEQLVWAYPNGQLIYLLIR